MFSGEIPGQSRLELLGRRRGRDRVYRNGRRRFVTKVNHFYNGRFPLVGTEVIPHMATGAVRAHATERENMVRIS